MRQARAMWRNPWLPPQQGRRPDRRARDGGLQGRAPASRRGACTLAHPRSAGDARCDPARRNDMCRWMAWLGQPVLVEELLFHTQHGIVDQRLPSRLGAEPTNGDGFGLGWYGVGDGPGLYHSVSPAWGDANLRELAAHMESPLFMAHVRAAIGSSVQQTNCHPFRHGRWLFVHNGYLGGFHAVRRELMLAIEPELFAEVQGSTDTEVVFYLALTFGLEEYPLGSCEHTVGLIDSLAERHGIADAVQATFGVAD